MRSEAHLVIEADEIAVFSPATLERVGSVRRTEPAELEEILGEARHAQGSWEREPFAKRKALLRRVAHEIVADDLAVARLIVDETGKPLVEAYTHDLFVAVEELMWLSAHLERVLSRERLRFPQLVLKQKRGWVLHEPVGVVGIISPWNFPLGLPLTQVATAVAAGNAVVLKPSELTPLVGAKIEELFRRAGAPAGLVRVVQGDGESIGASLVGHRQVDALVFTGSTEVGRDVASRAGERLCPITLELGGKDPMLVLEDADLERAIDGALWGSFANCGQICSGVERIYVHSTLHAAFVAGLCEQAQALRIGDGRDPGIELGPLISEEQRARIEGLVADAVDHGAELLIGGNRPATALPGWFHEPTILAGEPALARLRTEELFGPVVTVVSVDNDDEAVRRANDSRFALGASIWTRDVKRGHALSRRVRAGSVWLNDHLYSFSAGQAPWGGRGSSGMGRTHGRQGLESMSHVKFTDSDRGWITPGWWYPYSERVVEGFRGVLGGLHADGAGARVSALSAHRRGLAHLVRKALS